MRWDRDINIRDVMGEAFSSRAGRCGGGGGVGEEEDENRQKCVNCYFDICSAL